MQRPGRPESWSRHRVESVNAASHVLLKDTPLTYEPCHQETYLAEYCRRAPGGGPQAAAPSASAQQLLSPCLRALLQAMLSVSH